MAGFGGGAVVINSEDSEHQISDSNSWLALINPNG